MEFWGRSPQENFSRPRPSDSRKTWETPLLLHLIFIPSNTPTGNFVQNLTGHQFGKQETIKNAYHKHRFGNVYRGNKLHNHINETLA